MIGIFRTAWRNYARNLRRYRVLLVALVVITAVLTMVLSVVLGMRESLYEKAGRYFAGNLVVMGYRGTGNSVIENPDDILDAVHILEKSNLHVRAVSRRSTYYELNYIELFFAGYYMQQRRMVGVEWSRERPVLAHFDFVAGAVPEDGDEAAVLISTATADKLHIGVGDRLLISIRSDRGRTNTAELVVSGIFAESSFFGYQTYVHRNTLNRLREAPEETVNEIGIYLENPIGNEEEAARLLARELEKSLPVFGIMQTREDYSNESRVKRDSREYGVVTVGAQLEEIEDLLTAITLIAGVAMLAFLLIVVVGVGNTFTMIVWERTREIGTLRALGLQRTGSVVSFLAEAAFLGISGLVLGLLLALGMLTGIRSGFHFPPNMVTTLFLTQGRLYWILPLWGILTIAGLVIGASVLGSLRASLRAGKLSPVQAMNYRKK